MQYKIKQFERSFTRKLPTNVDRGRRHITYQICHNGRVIAWTCVSYGCREIDSSMASQMAKELCISNKTFDGIYRCPKGWEEYVADYDHNRNPRVVFSPFD